ncbi:MAG: class I poly(R)-hydroxyalkanoic acid synthase [Burkholderiales bacterium]|nr:class I poly(R)-hydroxyalkanoic acid synthase [Burkholderiales bacterium]
MSSKKSSTKGDAAGAQRAENPFAAWASGNPFLSGVANPFANAAQDATAKFAEMMNAAPGANPFAEGIQAMQTLMSSNIGQQPSIVSTVPAFAQPGPMPMPEAGWWWLPSVQPTVWQQALTTWFSPQTDVAALAAADRRFRSKSWESQPFFQLARDHYLRNCAFWREVVSKADLDDRERHRARFFVEQVLDATAPTNFFLTNPEAIERAIETKGESVKHGIENLSHDIEAGHIAMTDEKAFKVGENLAVTPGQVVFRNELIELIHYTPTEKTVYQRPLLIVPPCINKFYILDLKPENSFVAHAVAQGFDVYLVSWRNVGDDLKALTWEDYLEEGVLTAIDETRDHSGAATINTLGFCVGGTILSCALAVLASRGELDDFVESATYLTTLLDFTEPGDIKAYLGESTYQMRVQQFGPDGAGGMMKGSELAQSFASLRANDLIWNYVVNNYLKGQDPPAFDLLYWNGDSTNLPGPMYLYYLRNFYLDNKLTKPGTLDMIGEPVDLSNVDIPTYVYCSREDHIVPWKSAFASAELWGGDVEFVVGASGHIAGVINPPGPKKRSYWTGRWPADTPEAWDAKASEHAGSWWPHWYAWLAPHSGKRVPAKKQGKSPLGAAPGQFVLEKA